jgi:hypothetical protein
MSREKSIEPAAIATPQTDGICPASIAASPAAKNRCRC